MKIIKSTFQILPSFNFVNLKPVRLRDHRQPAQKNDMQGLLTGTISGRTGLLLSGLLVGIVSRPVGSFGVGLSCLKLDTRLRGGQGKTERSPFFPPNTKPIIGMSLSPKDLTTQEPLPTLNEFLIASSESMKSILLDSGAKTERHLTIVMGNEASDLDSMASSVLLAYAGSLGYLDNFYPNLRKESTVVPVMNIPRADYALRQVRPP
jgi:hypothetical protein